MGAVSMAAESRCLLEISCDGQCEARRKILVECSCRMSPDTIQHDAFYSRVISCHLTLNLTFLIRSDRCIASFDL
eukprot:scaffold94_cov71-Skeletonema_dohrnii-CCMP3373.AAC.2